MDRELMQSAQQFHIRRRQRSIWKKLVSVLGCIVVFCTTYALILPAITMERETICGIQEHQHSDSCYTKQVVKQLVCSAKDTGVHTHITECGSLALCRTTAECKVAGVPCRNLYTRRYRR